MRFFFGATIAAALLLSACGSKANAAPAPNGPHCADLFVQTQVSLAVVHGVWSCLEGPVQHLYKGTGDEALVGASPYFTADKFIGCDDSICVYSMAFEATTAGKTGVSWTTMTVWLDSQGLVAHAAVPKPVP